MAAIVTDQFRILNAENFVNSIDNSSNSYYVFVGLSNPSSSGFGRSADWDTDTPNPTDDFNYTNFVSESMMYGKRITSTNSRRVIKRIDWVRGKKYEMYRQDYNVNNPSPNTSSTRLYDTEYYVVNSEYQVYVCIDNGSTGLNPTGNASLDEPTFTSLDPSKAGISGDGYVWKYLFTISPNDIIKFDSTEYISLPNNWSTTTNAQIKSVRDNANSDVNLNQIKKVYIENRGSGYATGDHTLNILGDGSGAKVVVTVDTSGYITNTTVIAGGSGYTFGMVDLGPISGSVATYANLIPIIPPSKGHGYDIYNELGADKVLVYARFDDSTRDFPVSTSFSQIGIVKNPTSFGSTSVFTESNFSSLASIKFESDTTDTLLVGDIIEQNVYDGESSIVGKARGYVASYDSETKVAKYFQDRSLFLNPSSYDTVDHVNVSSNSNVYDFESSSENVTKSGFTGSVSIAFTGSTVTVNNKVISLGSVFTGGLSSPEINKGSGDIIYLDNRPEISRNSRQKEDVKIILEF